MATLWRGRLEGRRGRTDLLLGVLLGVERPDEFPDLGDRVVLSAKGIVVSRRPRTGALADLRGTLEGGERLAESLSRAYALFDLRSLCHNATLRALAWATTAPFRDDTLQVRYNSPAALTSVNGGGVGA